MLEFEFEVIAVEEAPHNKGERIMKKLRIKYQIWSANRYADKLAKKLGGGV